MAKPSVDHWLLALCDPHGLAELPVQRISLLQFQQLLALSEQHGVTGALLQNVQQLIQRQEIERLFGESVTKSDIPHIAAAIQETQQRWIGHIALTLCLRQRSIDVLDAFRRASLPAALIKGEDFTDRLYRQPSLRPFRDVDLMLPREMIDSTSDIMQTLGYRFVRPAGKYNDNYGERTWDSLSEPRTRVELHWNLINCPAQRRLSSLAFEELQWEETSTAERIPLRVTPAAMLLIATVHAVVSHRFDRLQHLCDIRQLCREIAGPLDIDWLRESAVRNGTSAALTGALAVTSRILNEPACESVLRQLRLPVARLPWSWLVCEHSLLHPETRFNKLRRTAIREWIKRAA